MTTLFDAILEVAKLVENVRTGITTAAGTTTTLIDTNATDPVDYWNNGLMFFISGALIGKTVTVTDWALSTFTFTFAAQSAAPGASASYAVAEQKYSRSDIVRAIQQAMLEIGPISQENTALVVVADQEEYDLPAGVSHLVKVEIATDDAAPYGYYTHQHWDESEDGHLRFDSDYLPDDEEGFKIRLTYNLPHAEVSTDAAVISPGIRLQLLKWMAAVNLYRTRYQSIGKDDPTLIELMNEAKNEAAKAMITYSPRRLSKTFRLGSW